MGELAQVSIVVIGRNEEKNLKITFAAIQAIDYPRERFEVIYVDSNSSDKSVEIAKQYADVVFIENHPLPSAARGRNRGLIEARYEIVHFVDGDVQIDPGYLKKAVAMFDNPEIHALSGCIIEKTNRGWNRIMSSAWIAPSDGFSSATSAGGTYRRSPLLQVNGYDERVVMGEETELGERFRDAGFNIWSMNQPMGVHHYAMGGFAGYLKWCIKNGRVRTRNLFLGSQTKFFARNRRLAIANIFSNCFSFMVVCFFIAAKKSVFLLPVLLLYILLFCFKYLVLKRIRNRRHMLYFLIMNVARPFSFFGQSIEYMKILFNGRYRKDISAEKELFDMGSILNKKK